MKIVPNSRILILELEDCPWFSPLQPRKGISVHIPVDANNKPIRNRTRLYYDIKGKFIGRRKV